MTHVARPAATFAAIVAAFASGCSVYPLPDDVSRSSTFDIVQRVRCEAKAGLKRFAPGDVHAQKIVAGTTIGYDFNFAIIEDNNAEEGELTLFRPPRIKGNTSFSLEATGSATRRRQNTRSVQFIEDLAELAMARCAPHEIARNGLYPIAGSLGMDEVVSTYIGLEKLSDLKRPTEGIATKAEFGAPKVALFADSLTFKTRIAAGATPSLELSAASGSLKVTNASLHASATRDDTHSLIVALARDPGKDVDPKVAAARGLRKTLLTEMLVREPRTETALAQRDAERRTRVLLELKRLRNLKNDEKEGPRYLGEKLLEFLRPPPGAED